MSEYEIGTTLGGMTALETLATPVELPNPEYYPYSRIVTLGDGSARGLGMPKAIWTFPLMEVAQITMLRTFCAGASATVFIRTKKNDGSYASFEGEMVWPVSKDGQHKANFPDHRAALVIEFRNLVEQAEGS